MSNLPEPDRTPNDPYNDPASWDAYTNPNGYVDPVEPVESNGHVDPVEKIGQKDDDTVQVNNDNIISTPETETPINKGFVNSSVVQKPKTRKKEKSSLALGIVGLMGLLPTLFDGGFKSLADVGSLLGFFVVIAVIGFFVAHHSQQRIPQAVNILTFAICAIAITIGAFEPKDDYGYNEWESLVAIVIAVVLTIGYLVVLAILKLIQFILHIQGIDSFAKNPHDPINALKIVSIIVIAALIGGFLFYSYMGF